MKKIFLVVLVIILIGFIAVGFNLMSINKQVNQSGIYLCPMHPTYTSDRPGDCPICGMRLVKKELRDESSELRKEKITFRKSKSQLPAPSSQLFHLEIDPAKEQYLGIKTTKTKFKEVEKEIKALGTVVPDETKLAHVHTKFSGYVHKVFADYEGKLVEKGQPLFTVYSPELVSTQEEFLLAIEAEEKLKDSKFPEIAKSQADLLEAVRKRLELWDISNDQIEKLKETRQVTKELTIYSHINGFVTKRGVFEGIQISPHEDLYEVADLSKVWVLVEVYENDLPFVMLGQIATINFDYKSIKPLTGKIIYIYPLIDPTTRTLKLRIEVNNPNFKLKPNMYVNATLATDIGKHVTVPTRAVIDSGKRQIVFVKEDKGKFVPKEVKVGPEVNDERVIYSGLHEDDEVVTDGNFLLDSETNLETALQQMKTTGTHAGHKK